MGNEQIYSKTGSVLCIEHIIIISMQVFWICFSLLKAYYRVSKRVDSKENPGQRSAMETYPSIFFFFYNKKPLSDVLLARKDLTLTKK